MTKAKPKPKSKKKTAAQIAPKTPAKKKTIAKRKARAHREETPLTLALAPEEYEAWKIGRRLVAYRPLGDIWNEKTCTIGREVHFSIGYDKAPRMRSKITAINVLEGFQLTHVPPDQYPDSNPTKIIAIAIPTPKPLTKKGH